MPMGTTEYLHASNSDIFFVLPMYNESANILNVIRELNNLDSNAAILIIDDASTDDSAKVVSQARDPRIVLLENGENYGHGKSVVRGLKKSLEFPNWKSLVTLDSDANFDLNTLSKCLEDFKQGNFEIMETFRVDRISSWFRKMASATTRILVFVSTAERSIDANSPVRVYKREVVEKILKCLPANAEELPNVYISIIIRVHQFRKGLYVLNEKIRSGNSVTGTTWNQRWQSIPSRKYLKFCINQLLMFPANLYRIKLTAKKTGNSRGK